MPGTVVLDMHRFLFVSEAKVYLQSLLIGAIVNFKRYWKLVTVQDQQDVSKLELLTDSTKTPLPAAV